MNWRACSRVYGQGGALRVRTTCQFAKSAKVGPASSGATGLKTRRFVSMRPAGSRKRAAAGSGQARSGGDFTVDACDPPPSSERT